MPKIKFLNQIKFFNSSITFMDAISFFDKNICKNIIAGKLNGNFINLFDLIQSDASLSVITHKDPDAIVIIRHSTAHLLAHAVKQLFPETKLAIGPVIENGFYYDFFYKRSFTKEDLILIEERMHKIASYKLPILRSLMTFNQAINFFKKKTEIYKLEILKNNIQKNEFISLYSQGEFVDLCKGPHVANTRNLKFFKLLKVSETYWKGNIKNEKLQRIYGTSWLNEKDLINYLDYLKEIKKRDHKKIGKKLDLYHFQSESLGIAFWHPKGVFIWNEIENYIRNSNISYGYKEIKTPIIANISIWEKTGHKEKYIENMFITKTANKKYVIRPMNCPMCIQVYNYYLHSYKDFPVRISEFGIVHRNEKSGALQGLMRSKSFTQDDAHIFCRKEELEKELISIIDQIISVYRTFHFNIFDIKLALRPKNRIGNDSVWDQSEKILKKILLLKKINYITLPGEGAFYGPKIEFHLKDAIGRSWQCGTIQIDFFIPKKLNAFYIDKNNTKKVPILIHRAILGSLERFIGIIIENYKGELPTWISPIQVVVMNITYESIEYAKNIYDILISNNIRSELDLRNEKIGFKIRTHTLLYIPYQIIIGIQEAQKKTVSIRTRKGKNLGNMNINDFIQIIQKDIKEKSII